MRIVLLLIAVFGISAAQEAELQCRCRLLQGDEYLCKCVAAKAAASSSSTVMRKRLVNRRLGQPWMGGVGGLVMPGLGRLWPSSCGEAVRSAG